MRAAVVSEFGPFNRIEVRDVPDPSPGQDELLVRITVAGVNFADTGMVLGTSRRAEPPFVPGVEAAGVVEEARGDSHSIEPGTRVVYWDPLPSAFAELSSVPAWRAVPIPDEVRDEDAVALMVQGATAHYLATDTTHLGPEQTCLVHSAAGGVGHLLVQVARVLGARVIAVVGSESKVELAWRLGAAAVIDRREDSLLEAVREATQGVGVDATFDAVGVDTIETSIQATKPGGTCVLYGGASGPAGEIDPSLTAGITFERPGLATHLANAIEYRRRMGDLFTWHEAGHVEPHLGGAWGLGGVPDALEAIASGETLGKLLIRPGRISGTGH